MRIAVLFNPGAGRSLKYNRIGELLSESLLEHEVYTYKENCGEAYLQRAKVLTNSIPRDYKAGIKSMTCLLAETCPELFICVGGDGLAAYVADALITGNYCIPIMGIAGGTANVGPIVSVKPDSLKDFNPSRLSYINAGAIKVTAGNKHIGYGFNDVVIGSTFLGTIDGKTVNISVESMVRKGEKAAETPANDIVTDRFNINKNGDSVKHSISKPAQIIVSSLEKDNFYGRAITGALCISAYSPLKAAIALFDQVIVKAEGDSKGIDSFMQAEHMLFGKGDTVCISGLSSKGHILIDGNPYFREEENIIFEYIPDLIKIARPVIEFVEK